MSQNDAQNCVNNCFVCGRQEDDLLKLEPELVQTLESLLVQTLNNVHKSSCSGCFQDVNRHKELRLDNMTFCYNAGYLFLLVLLDV